MISPFFGPPHRVFNFWRKWLLCAAIFVGIFGLFLIFLPAVSERFFDAIFFSQTPARGVFPPDVERYLRFLYGVLGAVLVGWSAALTFLICGPFARGERLAWHSVAASVALWFCLDCALSLQNGFWQNALLNLPFGILFFVPLWATRRFFKPVA